MSEATYDEATAGVAQANGFDEQDNTQNAAQSVSESGVLDVVTETIVYVVARSTKQPDGKLTFAERKDGNSIDKQILAGELEVLNQITVTVPFAHTLAGISQIVPDEEEAVAIWNKGASGKATNKLRQRFTEQNEAGDLVNTETSYDASEDVATPTNRRGLTDAQKGMKLLKSIPAADLLAYLKAAGLMPQA